MKEKCHNRKKDQLRFMLFGIKLTKDCEFFFKAKKIELYINKIYYFYIQISKPLTKLNKLKPSLTSFVICRKKII